MAGLILWLASSRTAKPTDWFDAGGFRVQTELDPARDVLIQIADGQPVLIVIDANQLPTWIAAVRSNPATRRIPIVAIADNDQQIAMARYVGITNVIAAAALNNANLFGTYVRSAPDKTLLGDACAEPLSALALKGLHEFNTREFYECHETLETAWKADTGPARDLYRVVLQVGLAYYQIERSNYAGALKMFLRTQQWFVQLPDQCRGVDLGQLRADASVARAHLEQLGPERVTQFDMRLIKPVQWTT